MTQLLRATLLLLAVAVLAGCTSARLGVGVPEGLLYRHVVVPVGVKRHEGPQRGDPVDIPRELAVGTATAYSLDFSIPMLEFTRILSVGWGDMSMERALANGNLAEMTYADGHLFSVLRIFNRARIVVYGPPASSTVNPE